MTREDRTLDKRDTMTAEERLRAVINLQVPDRVPASSLNNYFAGSYGGITMRQVWDDPQAFRAALFKCWEDLGPWDFHYPVNVRYPELYSFVMPMKARWPGMNLPDDCIHQLLEEEVLAPEDYGWVTSISRQTPNWSYIRLSKRVASRIWQQVEEGWRGYVYLLPRFLHHLATWAKEFEMWKRKGLAILYSLIIEAPFDYFSLARGLVPFIKDVRSRSEEIVTATDALIDGYVRICRLVAGLLRVPRIEIAVHRSASDFISPQTFRELSFPSLKKLVEKLLLHNITPILHCDGNWDLNLETLRELPAGSAMVQFDGPTDIFLAKRVIGDRVCIMGDVPNHLLCLGSENEVDEYCHRLIEEVGRDGGYVMGAGCEIPPNAKPENVRTMFQSVFKYGYYNK